jgi:membrane protein
MTKATSELERAESRVAACASSIVTQVRSLELKIHRSVTRPYLVASIGIAAAIAGYIVFRKPKEQQKRSPRSGAPSSLANMLKAVHLLSVFSGVIMAASLPVQNGSKSESQKIVTQTQPPIVPLDTRSIQQWQIVKEAFAAWLDDNAPSMGAALSYYTLFSLAPLLVIVIAVAGMLYGEQAAQGEIVTQLRGTIGVQGAQAVEDLIKVGREPTQGAIATLAGIAVLLLGATAVFAELQSALDRIWRVPVPPEESGVWHLLRTRLLSFGLLLGLGLMLTVSLTVSAALPVIGNWAQGWFAGSVLTIEILKFVASLGIFTLLFALVYKIMPRASIPWRDVWIGAAVTALLFSIGKLLIGLYLYKSSLASGFGAAGSFVVLFAWVYYSAQIFLFGAEYTWVSANRRGARMEKVASSNSAERGKT